MNDALELPEDDRQYIVDHLVEGYTPEEIALLLKNDQDSHVSQDTVEELAATDEIQDEVETQRMIQEKKANVSREELVADLKEAKQALKEQFRELRQSEHDDISNDTMSNLTSNIKLLGEFIGELQQKDSNAGGTVNINKLEQNFEFNQAIKYMPAEKKREAAEMLAEDPDVEDFAIVKNG